MFSYGTKFFGGNGCKAVEGCICFCEMEENCEQLMDFNFNLYTYKSSNNHKK